MSSLLELKSKQQNKLGSRTVTFYFRKKNESSEGGHHTHRTSISRFLHTIMCRRLAKTPFALAFGGLVALLIGGFFLGDRFLCMPPWGNHCNGTRARKQRHLFFFVSSSGDFLICDFCSVRRILPARRFIFVTIQEGIASARELLKGRLNSLALHWC